PCRSASERRVRFWRFRQCSKSGVPPCGALRRAASAWRANRQGKQGSGEERRTSGISFKSKQGVDTEGQEKLVQCQQRQADQGGGIRAFNRVQQTGAKRLYLGAA